jgi:homogentisate 1,2-dioxygenase
VQHGKRGIFAGLPQQAVFGEYAYVSQPAGGAKRALSEHLVPFRPAQHVRRGNFGELGSYEWRAAPAVQQHKQERKALAPFRPAHAGGGPFSR